MTTNTTTNLTSNLTNVVETKLLSLIENDERIAIESQSSLNSSNYMKLADLYLFHKEFKKEADILSRFSDHSLANSEELTDVYERLERNSKLQHQQLINEENSKK